ncbi:MAG: SIMPL domain-containing protein [Paludibacter sp.]|nr:SIMPL domain-containing protein [Paludibacter sp.]
MNEKNNVILISIAIIIGCSSLGFFIGQSIERFRKEDRSISVKGFSEKEVKSNFAVWTIKTRITTNDLAQGSKESEENRTKIIAFLLENGLKKNEIIQQNLNVTDKLAREYTNDIGAFRYIIENTLQVRTVNVDLVDKVSKETDMLLKAGILIAESNEYNPAIKYIYTGLNDIKPQMLSEATQNAKEAASEFTKQSDVKLAKLKKASQGLFSIVDRDQAIMSPSGDSGYSQGNVNDIYKKVRVVVSIEYSVD